MNALLNLDQSLFLIINGWHNSFMDPVMFSISSTIVWIPVYLVFLYFVFKTYGKQGWYILLLVAITIALVDQGTVHLFKNTFQRLRPSHEPSLEGLVHIVNNYKGGDYGFVSSHAANNFALVTFLGFFLRKSYKWLFPVMLAWAALIAYSRMYLGVHYPGDVLCGGLYGALVGYLVARYGSRWLKIKKRYPKAAL
jgi:undecaprenyl-diphosphatase